MMGERLVGAEQQLRFKTFLAGTNTNGIIALCKPQRPLAAWTPQHVPKKELYFFLAGKVVVCPPTFIAWTCPIALGGQKS